MRRCAFPSLRLRVCGATSRTFLASNPRAFQSTCSRTSGTPVTSSFTTAVGRFEGPASRPAAGAGAVGAQDVQVVADDVDPGGVVAEPEADDRGVEVVAEQVDLVPWRLGGVDGEFGGWQGKDEPAVTSIHEREAERVPKEGADRIGRRAEDYGVNPADHRAPFGWLSMSRRTYG